MKFGPERGSRIETLLAGAALGIIGMAVVKGAERFLNWRDERKMLGVRSELQALRDQVKAMEKQHKGATVHGQKVYNDNS
jgi:hypothetical protein